MQGEHQDCAGAEGRGGGGNDGEARDTAEASGTTIKVRLELVTPENLPHLKALNQAIFPIAYKDKFYRDCIAFEGVTLLAYCGTEVAGGIACRLEVAPGGARLYIMTLGVLAPFRGHGIGSLLLRTALQAVEFDHNIFAAYLHVQISNEEGMRFYKRYGFDVVATLQNYYRRLDPPHCHVLLKQLVPLQPSETAAASAGADASQECPTSSR